MVQADRRVVGNKQAAVEGQFPDQESGCKAVAVQQTVQAHNAGGQSGNLQQCSCQLGQERVIFFIPDLFLCGNHPVPDVEDRIRQVELDPGRDFVALIVLRILEDHVGKGAVVPGIILLVENEPVQFRQLADRPHIRRGNDLHEGNSFPLPILFRDIACGFLIVHLVFQENLRVTAHGHQVRGNLHDRVHVIESSAIRSASKHVQASLSVKTDP